MHFTRLKHIARSGKLLRGFRGYHRELRIGDSEFYDMENLSSRAYPLLTTRPPRRLLWEGKVDAMASLNGLCYFRDGVLHFGDRSVKLFLPGGEKQLVPFGAYLLIFPDKIWVNTLDGSYGSCERGEQFFHSVGLVWCQPDGTPYETVVDGETAPENTAQMWLDTSQRPPVLRQYIELTRQWSAVEPPCLRLICDRIGELYPAGKRITFRQSDELWELFGDREHTVLAAGRDYIVLQGSMPFLRRELGRIQFEVLARLPAMDFVFEHENRLWGCRYGLNNDGEFVNEIYASKLGDFTDFSSFRGISTDSYIASCGTEGKWTGAICAQGYPLFFKESVLHKVYGSYPANYRVQVQPCRGVMEGCGRSLAVMNGVVYYKSRSGICAYDGSLPDVISADLGRTAYHSAVAGSVGLRYYISMLDEENRPHLFCYDAETRLWHREDGLRVAEFCAVGDSLYYTEPARDRLCLLWGTAGEPLERRVKWYAVTGLLGAQEAGEGRYLSELSVRLSMEPGAQVKFFAQYDSCGTWEPLGAVSGLRLQSCNIPLRPRRCDHLRLRMEGEGEVLLHTMTCYMEGT